MKDWAKLAGGIALAMRATIMVALFLLAHYAAGWSRLASAEVAAGFWLIATLVVFWFRRARPRT